MSWAALTRPEAFRSPAFIALVAVLCVAVVLLLHHCVLLMCCGAGADRRRRRQHHRRHLSSGAADQQGRPDDDEEEEEAGVSVEAVSATSRTHLVPAAAVVVGRYRKEECWNESTCPVCLADFDDGEAVRVLPECMHYFHADCIDTWLRGSTSCPMCRAETTPTPTHTPSPASTVLHHHRLDLSVSVSLEEILVRT